MKGMRGLLWISVVLAALVMIIPGGITGAYAADTSGSNISWEYNSDDDVLFIDGSGSIPDYASGSAPWNAYKDSAKWISIGENITGIGANAFAGFSDASLRIIFNQSTQPTISSTAFNGITAVCRYFSTSWNVSGNYGGTSISWVYLPFNQFDDVYGSVYLVFKGDNNWQMCAFDEDQDTTHYYSVAKAQIDEAAYDRTIALDFEAIPTSTDDQAVYLVSGSSDTLLDSVSQITVSGTSSGSLKFTLNSTSKLFIIELLNPNATLTVDASAIQTTTDWFEIRSVGGSLTYTGNVQQLGLQDSGTSCQVSITGDVNEVIFYDSTSDTPFKGDLTVTGTVKKGYVRGTAAISGIPGTDSVIRPTAAFGNINQSTPIIDNGELKVGTTPLTPTADMYYLEYYLSNSGKQLMIGLALYPKEDYYDTIGEEASSVSDLNVTPDQIVPGSSVQLSVTSDYGQLVLNGTKDTAGNTVGFYVLGIDSGNITVNCPVELFTVNESTSSQYASNVVMNSTAQRFTISGSEGMTISLGENGKVVKGIWERGMRSPRYFDGTEGAATLFKNGTLRVLSWREGETIKSILPSNDEVSEAAGVAATVDLTESSASELTSEENQALAEFLSSNNGWKIAAVFDVSVNKVEQDEEGNEVIGASITSLNLEVPLAVSNEADSSAFVVRLHDDNGTVSAAQLSQATDEETLQFASGLFSKYVIVSASEGSGGTCGENLTWKMDADGNLTITGTGAMYPYSLVQGASTAPWGDAVTSVTIGSGTTSIGDYAFYGCAGLKEITLPDSVTAIGEGAFAGCSNLETALIPASVTSIGKDAFASCPKLTIYCYPGSAALAYAKANSIPYVVIGEEATATPAPTATPTAVPTAVPKTGDASSPALWIGLVLLGVLGVGAAVVLRRRK